MKRKSMIKQRIRREWCVVLIAIAVLSAVTIFLSGCSRYLDASLKISNIEENATLEGHYTAYGWESGWNDQTKEAYNQAKQEQIELVQSSDIANWCYLSGYTTTGKFVRLGLICLAVGVEILIIIFLIAEIRYIQYLRKCLKAKKVKVKRKSH